MPLISIPTYAADTALPQTEGDVLLIGRRGRLRGMGAQVEALGVAAGDWSALLQRSEPGDGGATGALWAQGRKISVGVLPEACSRHNSPARVWAIPGMVRAAQGRAPLHVVLLVEADGHARAAALAVARALPLFSLKTGPRQERAVYITALGPSGYVADPGGALQAAIEGVRLAGRLVDTPTDMLHTDAFVEEAAAVARTIGATCEVIRGEALREQGFGGLWGVGRAATHPPALVTLRWRPPGAQRTVAWVGKGIVYDTGGLSLKSKTGMPGMKGDMAGAAAVLGALLAAARAGVDYGILAILCLAENAVGPEAIRPDDVLRMRSGKTVEINNTDAEGRLVLADGVAWACEQGPLDLLVDLATLTGAALVATGKLHAALYCNDETVERAAVEAGRAVGEPCHPLLYAPELLRKEFKSEIADMKNSVADRANAQSSCAGQFIHNHLPARPPRWLHVDLAGPAMGSDGRGTGFGVGLLLTLGAGPY